MTGYRRHVFVCLNTRDAEDPRGCCADRGSEAIYAVLREGAAKAKLKDVRINRAGCLDHCASGPSVVTYPEGVWYRVPTVDDAKRIVESHIINGRIVTDLLMETFEAAKRPSDARAR
jgi:(2Fe-2S) ferredoxin